MRTTTLLPTTAFMFALFGLVGCSDSTDEGAISSTPPANTSPTSSPVDYSLQENWFLRPARDTANTSGVDVFFVLPTMAGRYSSASHLCDIKDSAMHANAPASLMLQASAFDSIGRIFIPYYRQGDASYLLKLSIEERREFIRANPAADVLAAFEAFLKEDNKNRPFILAGHSQGSDVLLSILIHYMATHPEVYARMVAAYLVGTTVSQEQLVAYKHLRFAERSDDTGVIISYNTESPNYNGTNPLLVEHPIAINPISWSRGPAEASKENNLGSRVPLANKRMVDTLNFANAQVDTARGVVKCAIDPSVLAANSWPKGIFHSFDYGLYFHNLRENAAKRAQRFRLARL